MTKIVKIGLCTIRNEEIDILGWARMMRSLVDHTFALVDPNTTDRTIEILKEQCPWVTIFFQDRTLGDSDELTKGETATLIMHTNKTKWIHDNIPEGEWFIEMAADERFHPNDFSILANEVKHAQEWGCDAVTHQNFFEPVNLDRHQLYYYGNTYYGLCSVPYLYCDYEMQYRIKWGGLFAQPRFQVRSEDWKQGDQPHQGFHKKLSPLNSVIPIYHFHRIKLNTFLPQSWRDLRGGVPQVIKDNKGRLPLVRFCNPFKDWKNMSELEEN